MKRTIVLQSVVTAVLAMFFCVRIEGQSTDVPDVLASQLSQFLTSSPVDRPNQCYKGVCRPLLSYGNVVVQQGGQYNVNPRLVIAISGAESDFGAHMCSANNAWNWFWNGACPPLEKSPFDTWDSGIHTVSHFLQKSYILHGYNTIPLIGHRYCVDKCDFWEKNVTNFYQQLGGDMSTLMWTPEAGGAQPQPQPTPQPLPVPTTTSKQPRLTVQIESVSGSSWFAGVSRNTQVALSAVVTGAVLTANPTVFRVVDGASQQIGTLTPTGGATNNQTNYGGELNVKSAPGQELQIRVVGRYKVKTQTKQLTSTASIMVPAQNNALWWEIGIGLAVVLILVLVLIFVRMRHHSPGQPQLVKERQRPAGAA